MKSKRTTPNQEGRKYTKVGVEEHSKHPPSTVKEQSFLCSTLLSFAHSRSVISTDLVCVTQINHLQGSQGTPHPTQNILAIKPRSPDRSEEHTSELQSLTNLVCR